ncbi:hypothetical protein G4B88_001239 [Cannabis sativa]|uniref:Uncharacterized protein n=1 Tax=Cannabis sativa TaxID=3483 RepID=A0A7J6HZG7_CANSA|nr:hypothetical protein G4B88_001239 [Cannabis sativa]
MGFSMGGQAIWGCLKYISNRVACEKSVCTNSPTTIFSNMSYASSVTPALASPLMKIAKETASGRIPLFCISYHRFQAPFRFPVLKYPSKSTRKASFLSASPVSPDLTYPSIMILYVTVFGKIPTLRIPSKKLLAFTMSPSLHMALITVLKVTTLGSHPFEIIKCIHSSAFEICPIIQFALITMLYPKTSGSQPNFLITCNKLSPVESNPFRQNPRIIILNV